MDSEVERCKRIVNQLLDLSRPRAGTKTPQDLNHIVEETLRLLKHHDRFKHLVVRREMTAALPPVQASGDHLTQVFMALMLNLCHGRVRPDSAIESTCTSNTTVGQSQAQADALRALIVLDAAVVLGWVGPAWSCAVIALLAPMLLMERRFNTT